MGYISFAFRLSCLLLLGIWCHSANGQQLVEYEYWFDNNYAARTIEAVTPTENFELSTSLNTSSLSTGSHRVHFRFKQDDGTWGASSSHQFYIPAQPQAGTELTTAEYWFNHDISQAQTATLSGPIAQFDQSIDLSGLEEGFHILSFRFRDNEGKWTPPVNKRIWAEPSEESIVIAYRYWYDGNFGLATTVQLDDPGSPYSLSTSLPTGDTPAGPNHNFCIQFQNSQQIWSAPFCQLFDNYFGCLGDLNFDGLVDTSDLLIFLGSFGCNISCDGSDLNFDGQVDSQDLLIFLGAIGSFCE